MSMVSYSFVNFSLYLKGPIDIADLPRKFQWAFKKFHQDGALLVAQW